MIFDVETQVLGIKPHKPFKNSFPEITGCKEQLPYYIDFKFFQLQLEGGYNPLIYRLQHEGSNNSLVLRLQPEGGYNPLSFPRLAT